MPQDQFLNDSIQTNNFIEQNDGEAQLIIIIVIILLKLAAQSLIAQLKTYLSFTSLTCTDRIAATDSSRLIFDTIYNKKKSCLFISTNTQKNGSF